VSEREGEVLDSVHYFETNTTHVGDDKLMQNFSIKTLREEKRRLRKEMYRGGGQRNRMR
jgi:hypothetical protein